MAGRGQVSWLPGIGRPHLPGGSVSPPVADANAPAASFAPVTVAGPRRLLTGLPLTTDRIYVGESTRRQRPQPGASILPESSDSNFRFCAPHARRRDLAWPRASQGRKSNPRNNWPWHDHRLWRSDGHGLARRRSHAEASRRAERRVEQSWSGCWFHARIGLLPHGAGCPATMQTMTRRSTRTIMICSALTGMLSVALAIVTRTGTAGAYVFALLAMPVLLAVLMWPERTRFFVGRSHSRRHGRTRSRRRRPRAL